MVRLGGRILVGIEKIINDESDLSKVSIEYR